MPKAEHIQRFDFLRNKYGPELLIDVGQVDSLPNFVLSDIPHTLSFYEILFITEGSGTFSLDHIVHELQPGKVIFTSPGQVRRWVITSAVKGYTLFFEEAFISSFFNDPLFLHRFQFFHNPTQPHALATSPDELQQLKTNLYGIEQEFHQLQNDSPHMLRALFYQMLVSLNRLYARQHHTESDTQGNHSIYSFRQLLETHFRERHQVQDYADLLNITPAHLNDLTQRYFGTSASSLIKGRLLLEAKRELLYTPKTVSEIAYQLHFSDTANFNRFFRANCGLTPKTYREQAMAK